MTPEQKKEIFEFYKPYIYDMANRGLDEVKNEDDFDNWVEFNRYYLEESQLEAFHGMTRMVFHKYDYNWVIKIDFKFGSSFGKGEVEVYKKAVVNNYDFLFAESCFLGFFYGYDVFAMQYAPTDDCLLEDSVSSLCGCSISELDDEDLGVFSIFAHWYEMDEDEVWEIVHGILQVTDVHMGNCGWIEGRPVLIDYCPPWSW